MTSFLVAYQAITGKRVFPRMMSIVAQILRRHGPDAQELLAELFSAHGTTTNLLAVMLRWPPTHEPEDMTSQLVAEYFASQNPRTETIPGTGPHPFCDLAYCRELASPDTAEFGGATYCVSCRDWSSAADSPDGA